MMEDFTKCKGEVEVLEVKVDVIVRRDSSTVGWVRLLLSPFLFFFASLRSGRSSLSLSDTCSEYMSNSDSPIPPVILYYITFLCVCSWCVFFLCTCSLKAWFGNRPTWMAQVENILEGKKLYTGFQVIVPRIQNFQPLYKVFAVKVVNVY